MVLLTFSCVKSYGFLMFSGGIEIEHKEQITHFMSLASFHTPWKHQRTRGLMLFSAFFVQGHLKHRWDLRATVWNDPISPAAQWTFRSKNNRTCWHVANGSVNANTVEIKNVGSDFWISSCHYHGIWMILVIWSLLC